MSKMSQMLLWIVFLTSTHFTSSKNCPPELQRFSRQHSYCIPPNYKCNIVEASIPKGNTRQLILDVHNEFRSKVANGNEHRAGHLPTASNMMQLEWDDDLAAVALSWAKQCKYEHDCSECRALPAYNVGQNIGKREFSCEGIANCVISSDANTTAWKEMITNMYGEVKDFNKRYIPRYEFSESTGHFTQIIWANTWRVGCGYVLFNSKSGQVVTQLYVCNYGPGGNVITYPVYKEGRTCTECPSDACCDSSCGAGMDNYPGLCKMLDPDEFPVYLVDMNSFIFYCDFTDQSASSTDKLGVRGDGDWNIIETVDGKYLSVTLTGGQEGTLDIVYTLKPNRKPFCVRLELRKSAALAEDNDASRLVANFNFENSQKTASPIEIEATSLSFFDYSIDLEWRDPTTASFTFSVPNGFGDHILDIKRIMVFNGECRSR